MDRYASRVNQANKIEAVLKHYISNSLDKLQCLDLGCDTGDITEVLSKSFASIMGVDINPDSIKQAVQSKKASLNAIYVLSDGGHLPFSTGLFDVVICAQVYEHSTDQVALASEVWRVLKPGGVCFFSGPNKYTIIEEHYWLPFLSWFPRFISDRYVRLFKKATRYDINPLSYFKLLQLWKAFKIVDYTPILITEPDRFRISFQIKRLKIIRQLPYWLVRGLKWFYPNFNWILVKSK